MGQVHKWDGRTWTTYDLLVLDGFASEALVGGGAPVSMTVAPNGTLWVASCPYYEDKVHYSGGLHSYDGNEWKIYTYGGVPYTAASTPTAIGCDNGGQIFVGFNYGSVNRYRFDGTSWNADTADPIVKHSAVNCFVTSRSGKVFYIGVWDTIAGHVMTYSGVFQYQSNGSTTFDPLGLGADMKLSFSEDGSLWGCTYNGLWVNHATSGVASEPDNTASLSVYPNPFNNTATISYSLPTESAVTIDVFNAIGVRVAELSRDVREPSGEHSTAFDGRALPGGTYCVQIRALTNEGTVLSQSAYLSLLR